MGAILSPGESLTALVPLIGATGLGGVLIAYFAYRTEVAKGRKGDPQHAAMGGISALLADSTSMQALVLSLDRCALAMDKIALLSAELKHDSFKRFDDHLDEVIRIRRALEEANKRQD